MIKISFTKMHGCGNDFVIIDNRKLQYDFSIQEIKQIADRHYGVGCDQLIVICGSNKADRRMDIYNIDGSISGMCGNAARCVAKLIMEEINKDKISLEVGNRILYAQKHEKGVMVNMGEAFFDWQKIPLSKEFPDTLNLPIEFEELRSPSAVSIGNPHMVFFVNDIDKIDLKLIGKDLEHHIYFPQKTNVTIAQVISYAHIKIKVWERGAGETLACGSAACAVLAAAHAKNLVGNESTISLPGGDIYVKIDNSDIYMTGPAEISFYGSYVIS